MLSLNEIKVLTGNMIMAGFDGYSVPESLAKLINEYHIGGVILFDRNINSPEQVKELTASLKSLSPTLFIAVDQEGGRVARIKFIEHKSALSVATEKTAEEAYLYYKNTGTSLKSLGFNLDFAPVLDVNTNPLNPIIGDRAYGSDVETVTAYGISAIKGLEDAGIISCGKHFPGHGDTINDSHFYLPVLKHDMERLNNIELYPFKAAIASNLSSIMTAHILFPLVDSKPATLSPKIITEILRKELAFDNIVFTDDMEMKAIADNYRIGDASVQAVLAGADIVLVCKSLDKQIEAAESLFNACCNKEIPEDMIINANKRINKIKHKFGLE